MISMVKSFDASPFPMSMPQGNVVLLAGDWSQVHLCLPHVHEKEMAQIMLSVDSLSFLIRSYDSGDVADTIRDKPRYISYGGLGCDPKKNPRCRLNPNPTPSGRGCKAEHRCREG
ncbi:hypothetical protein POTOM_053624 [Populus tomentosa]|uniref:Uncharacterized protein n=1 Tax=Populus tomentosa TaxID=118781 RepID=A0A8X8BZJ1_POPTO|nr:hypothetical protein POTOM_053624 [Populus tomentosa]